MAEFVSPSIYTIVVNDYQINKVDSFTITRSIENFVDTFEISFGNKTNEVSPKIYLGDRVEFRRNNKDVIFTGIIETKQTESSDSDLRLRVSGRDTIADLVESKAVFQNFKNTTDNAIIDKVITQAGTNYTLQLSEATNVSEYTVNPGDTVGAVIDGVVKLNGFFIWKRGNTIIKGKTASSGPAVYSYRIANPLSGENNVLRWQTSESISGAKTYIEGLSNDGGRAKENIIVKNPVSVYQSSAYQTMLRNLNGHNGSSSRITRKYAMAVSGKNIGEAQRQVDMAAKQAEPAISITIEVKGFQDFELNDIIHVANYFEGIDNNFVLTGVTYTLDRDSRASSLLTLQPLGSFPQ